jgi:MFS transporter, UMF1 family
MSANLNDKKTIFGWTMYDWANSVFSLTIATAIFPPYFEAVSKSASVAAGNPSIEPYYISLFGYKIVNTALYSYTLSLGFLLVTFISPILSGIADSRGNKKQYLKFFCYMGSLSCVLMYFFTSETLFTGLTLFLFSIVGFGGSIVFYNAFLPEIATEDQFDRISARGFSMGYIGSVILLIINLTLIMFPQIIFPVDAKAAELIAAKGLGMEEALKASKGHYEGIASRLAFVSVGLWWAGFAQIAFRRLPGNKPPKNSEGNIFGKGFRELQKVWNEIKTVNERTHIKRYLWGFFFTSMGLQTVMYVATLFGSQELKLNTADLIVTVLIIQLIAVLGAWGFSRISERIGNIYTLLIMVVIWIGICGVAYFVKTEYGFYGLAAVVGLVMGGIQSMFRSTFAKLIPDQTPNHASYFSFYDVCEKLAIVIGTFSYGLLADITGNMRMSILALATYFIIGLFFLARIKNFKTIHP